MTYTNETGYPSVTTILRPYLDTEWFTQEAAERGTAVHGATAAYLRGAWTMPLPAAWQPYFDSARQWIHAAVKEPILIEERLTDPRLGFCGKPDLICTLIGSDAPVLIDFKTSQAYYKWWEIQAAAYRHLAFVDRGIKTERSLSVRLKADGSGVLINEHPQRTAEDMNIFRGLLNAHNFFNGR